MNVILFGATGMVGQGVLRECLLDADVQRVLVVGRTPTGVAHAKVHEVVHKDFLDFSSIAAEFAGYDACFFCLGVSSVGMSEADYTRITYDMTMAAAKTILAQSPALTFIYVSGESTDSTERGKTMWARVKGRTENALLAMPFKAAYMFRPGFIQPMHGIRSKTKLYNALYVAIALFYPLIRRIIPRYSTTTEEVGRAMIRIVKKGSPEHILNTYAIHQLGV